MLVEKIYVSVWYVSVSMWVCSIFYSCQLPSKDVLKRYRQIQEIPRDTLSLEPYSQ